MTTNDSHFRSRLVRVIFTADDFLVLLELVKLFLDGDDVVVDGLFKDEKLGGREVAAGAPSRLRNTPVI